MIGTLLALASLAATAYGSAKSAQSTRATDRMLQQRRNDLDAWYDRETYQDYLTTPEGASGYRALKDQYANALKKTKGTAAVMGSTPEKEISQQGELQRNYLQALARLAGEGGAAKQANTERLFAYRDTDLFNQIMANQEMKTQQWSNLSGNALNAAIGFGELEGAGGFKPWEKGIKDWFYNYQRRGSPTKTIKVGTY